MRRAQSFPSRSCLLSRLFRIGKNSRGNWVVQDQQGLCGGLFADRAEALRFALYENGNRPQAVIMVPGVLELDLSGQPSAGGDRPRAYAEASLQPQAA
jgi:hypothetical protein